MKYHFVYNYLPESRFWIPAIYIELHSLVRTLFRELSTVPWSKFKTGTDFDIKNHSKQEERLKNMFVLETETMVKKWSRDQSKKKENEKQF